jgi:hypothetical protein
VGNVVTVLRLLNIPVRHNYLLFLISDGHDKRGGWEIIRHPLPS